MRRVAVGGSAAAPAVSATLVVSATLAAFVALALLTASPARAMAPADAESLSAVAAEPWLARQLPNGSFRDYVAGRHGVDSYGPGMLGYALLDQGLRTGSRRHVDAGLRALRFAARRALRVAKHHTRAARRVVFDNWAVASAYNLARGPLAGDPYFEAIAPLMRESLRHMGRRVLGAHGYYNFKLVHAASVMELLNSGLRSNVPGATLTHRKRAARWVRRLINHDVPLVARFYDRGKGLNRTTVVSDPPWNPPAYQAFSLMMLTRTIDRMGAAASKSARAALVASIRGMAQTMAPDGDVSYFGRSQEQSWTLTSVAYAAAVARRTASPALDPELAAIGWRALTRLHDNYWRADLGMVMTPSFVDSAPGRATRGVDTYAAGTSYAALTIVGLELAAHERPLTDGASLPVPADGAGVRFIGRGQSTLATVRTGDIWFAVTRAPARVAGKNSLYARDMRYDAGLAAFKWLRPDGRWVDIMSDRPRTTRADSAGPAIRRFGRVWRPVGRAIRAAAGGAIVIDGDLRDFQGRPAHRRAHIVVAPYSCGVQVSFGAHGGERTEYSLFFRRRPSRRAGGRRSVTLSDAAQTVTATPAPGRIRLRGGYASGADAGLVRAKLIFRPAGDRRVSVTICPRGTV